MKYAVLRGTRPVLCSAIRSFVCSHLCPFTQVHRTNIREAPRDDVLLRINCGCNHFHSRAFVYTADTIGPARFFVFFCDGHNTKTLSITRSYKWAEEDFERYYQPLLKTKKDKSLIFIWFVKLVGILSLFPYKTLFSCRPSDFPQTYHSTAHPSLRSLLVVLWDYLHGTI